MYVQRMALSDGHMSTPSQYDARGMQGRPTGVTGLQCGDPSKGQKRRCCRGKSHRHQSECQLRAWEGEGHAGSDVMTGSRWKILACVLAWSVTLCAGEVRPGMSGQCYSLWRRSTQHRGDSMTRLMSRAGDKAFEDLPVWSLGQQRGRVARGSATCGRGVRWAVQPI